MWPRQSQIVTLSLSSTNVSPIQNGRHRNRPLRRGSRTHSLDWNMSSHTGNYYESRQDRDPKWVAKRPPKSDFVLPPSCTPVTDLHLVSTPSCSINTRQFNSRPSLDTMALTPRLDMIHPTHQPTYFGARGCERVYSPGRQSLLAMSKPNGCQAPTSDSERCLSR